MNRYMSNTFVHHLMAIILLAILLPTNSRSQEPANTSIYVHIFGEIRVPPTISARVVGRSDIYIPFRPAGERSSVFQSEYSEDVRDLEEIFRDGGSAKIDIHSYWTQDEYPGLNNEYIFLELDESDLGEDLHADYYFRPVPPRVQELEVFMDELECTGGWSLDCSAETRLQCPDIGDRQSYVLNAYYTSRRAYHDFRRRQNLNYGYEIAVKLWYHSNYRLANMADTMYRIDHSALSRFKEIACDEATALPDP